MSLPKTVYEALKAVMTVDSRLSRLSEEVGALSEKVEGNASRLATIVQNHAERLARVEGKFELLETSLATRRRKFRV